MDVEGKGESDAATGSAKKEEAEAHSLNRGESQQTSEWAQHKLNHQKRVVAEAELERSSREDGGGTMGYGDGA